MLENHVEFLQEQSIDIQAKSQATSNLLFQSPMDAFFGAAGFWQDPVDVGYSECMKGCSKRYVVRRDACDEIPDEADRTSCNTNVSNNNSSCKSECVEQFNPFPGLLPVP